MKDIIILTNNNYFVFSLTMFAYHFFFSFGFGVISSGAIGTTLGGAKGTKIGSVGLTGKVVALAVLPISLPPIFLFLTVHCWLEPSAQ